MGLYTIRYACGHSEEKQLYGKMEDRQRFIDYAAEHLDCPACRKRSKAADIDAFEIEHDLPSLTGTDKQVAWARTIRMNRWAEVDAVFDRYRQHVLDGREENFETHCAVVRQMLASQQKAKWWIDRRETEGEQLARDAYELSRHAAA